MPGADVRTYDDDPTKFADLNNGRTDAILIDRLAALEYAKKAPKTVAAGEAFSRQEAGIALRKGEPELLAALNKATRRTACRRHPEEAVREVLQRRRH